MDTEGAHRHSKMLGTAAKGAGTSPWFRRSAGAHTASGHPTYEVSSKVDAVRVRTAPTCQGLRQRAGTHTRSVMDSVGAPGAETSHLLRWGAGTNCGHSGRPQTFNDTRGGCQGCSNEPMVEEDGGSTQRAATQRREWTFFGPEARQPVNGRGGGRER